MKTRGFTLIELVVATAIFAIVVSAAFALFDSSRSVSSRAEFRAELFQTARAALQRIEDDLRGAFMPADPVLDTGFLGTSSGAETEPLDRLELFSVNAHTGGSRDTTVEYLTRGADLRKTIYYIEQDASRKAHGLVRERPIELTPTAANQHREEDVVEVARDVVFLGFRYLDDGDWIDTWDSTLLRKLPKAVEATIYVQGEWRNQKIVEPFKTRIYLPVGGEQPEKPLQ